ncbi:spore germination protein [Clostridiaceae bacterium 35-E11]
MKNIIRYLKSLFINPFHKEHNLSYKKVHHDDVKTSISKDLDKNLNYISGVLGENNGIITEKFLFVNANQMAGIVYLEKMADLSTIRTLLSEYLNSEKQDATCIQNSKSTDLKLKMKEFFRGVPIQETKGLEKVCEAVLKGHTCLLVDGINEATLINTRKFDTRKIEKPEIESTIYAPKEAFVEDVETNCMMVRRRLPTPTFKLEAFTIGRLSQTSIRLGWLEGIANEKIIEEARRRIARIDIDCIHNIAMLADFIEDNPKSLWPQYKLVERPDVVAYNLSCGQFAIFCDGNPFVLIAPTVITQHIQTMDDFSQKPIVGTLLKIFRISAFMISTSISSIYISFVAYHHGIIPPHLALHISLGRKDVPFPTIIEILLLTFAVDLLREVGKRLPGNIGSATSILGAVVIGQAAVEAGYVSAAVIIIVAIGAISSYSIPSEALYNSNRITNYFLILLSGVLGIYGAAWGMILILWRITTLRSFGIPLFYPIAPIDFYGMRQVFTRMPMWKKNKRLKLFAPTNKYTMDKNIRLERPGTRNPKKEE